MLSECINAAEHGRYEESTWLTLIECIRACLAGVPGSLVTAQFAEIQLIPRAITAQAAAIWEVLGDPVKFIKHESF